MNKFYVDFHLHTCFSRTIGDSINWISLEDTLYKLVNKKVNMISFTDHDIFDYNLFEKANRFIKDNNLNLIIFPGVEMTIQTKSSKKGHCLYIFDKNIDSDKMKKLSSIINMFRNREGCNPDIFTSAIKDFDFIMIPHVSKADSNLKYTDLENQIQYINYIEGKKDNKQNQAFIKNANKDIKTILMSDTHYWDQNNYLGSKCYTQNNKISNIKEIQIEMEE